MGALTVSEEDGRLVSLDWGTGRDQSETTLLREARAQLHAYFDGARMAFDLPLASAASPYGMRIRAALLAIPYGQTRSYRALAERAGGSARSVGQANARNTLPIIVPCHRVVGTSGPGGYSGGDGLETKRALMALETAYAARFAKASPL